MSHSKSPNSPSNTEIEGSTANVTPPQEAPPITVVIVDDHPVVRAGLRMVLEAAGDLTVVAEGATGADALRLVGQHCPDVLVLDVNLPDPSPGSGPDLNGLEVTRQLCMHGTTTAILILTAHSDSQTVFGLMESGAIGYVLKDEALETLANAVRAAARGESWLSPSVASQMVRRAVGHAPISSPAPLAVNLTPRETEVLCLLAQGLDNAAIAERLALTMRTVQNHVSNIYGKLDVTTRTEAALYAIRHGLVQISSAEDASYEP